MGTQHKKHDTDASRKGMKLFRFAMFDNMFNFRHHL